MGARDLITFDEASHTYRDAGGVVPGVTSILRPLSNFDGINPAVLAAKADLGRRVHTACEFDDDGDLDEETVQDDVAPYLRAYRAFRRQTGAAVVLNEVRVFDRSMRYAGTLDRVMDLNGARWLVDLKTCISTPIAVGPQTAAYLRALADPAVTHRAALRLRPDGTYRFEPLTGADDWSTFLACLTLLRFKESHQ